MPAHSLFRHSGGIYILIGFCADAELARGTRATASHIVFGTGFRRSQASVGSTDRSGDVPRPQRARPRPPRPPGAIRWGTRIAFWSKVVIFGFCGPHSEAPHRQAAPAAQPTCPSVFPAPGRVKKARIQPRGDPLLCRNRRLHFDPPAAWVHGSPRLEDRNRSTDRCNCFRRTPTDRGSTDTSSGAIRWVSGDVL